MIRSLTYNEPKQSRNIARWDKRGLEALAMQREGMTAMQIARALNLDPSTVKARMARVRDDD